MSDLPDGLNVQAMDAAVPWKMTEAKCKEGEETPYGKITRVHCSGKDHWVYETDKGAIVADAEDAELSNKFGQITCERSEWRFLAQEDSRLKRIAHDAAISAYVSHAAGEPGKARHIVMVAKQRLIKLRDLEARLQYLLGCGAMVLLAVLVLVTFVFLRVRDDVVFLVIVAACGSGGAGLSVMHNLRAIQIDYEAPTWLNLAFGASRIWVGMIGGVIIYFLIKGNILLGVVAQTNSVYATLALCVVGGFSETFVPNVLGKIEEQGTTGAGKVDRAKSVEAEKALAARTSIPEEKPKG